MQETNQKTLVQMILRLQDKKLAQEVSAINYKTSLTLNSDSQMMPLEKYLKGLESFEGHKKPRMGEFAQTPLIQGKFGKRISPRSDQPRPAGPDQPTVPVSRPRLDIPESGRCRLTSVVTSRCCRSGGNSYLLYFLSHQVRSERFSALIFFVFSLQLNCLSDLQPNCWRWSDRYTTQSWASILAAQSSNPDSDSN